MRIQAVAIACALLTCAPCVFAGLTLPPSPALRGVPLDDREDVPTDVVPAFDAGRLRSRTRSFSEGDFTLRSSSGNETPISVTLPPGDGYLVIQPGAALEPHTKYTLSVHLSPINGDDGEELSLSFTTGAGPLDSSPQPVSGVVQHWRAPHGSSEDYAGEGACIGFSPGPDELVETRFTDPGYPDRPFPFSDVFYDGLYAGSFLSDLNDGGYYFPPCVQFRRRAINGTFSEPTTTCGADSPVYSVEGFDAQQRCSEVGFVDAKIFDGSAAGSNPQWSAGDSPASCRFGRGETPPGTRLVVLALGACIAFRRALGRARRARP